MEIGPIINDADHAAALEEIDHLFGAAPDSEEGRKLAVLIVLVDAYENEHHHIEPPEPIDAILFRMDQLGLTRKDLEPFIGSRARVSEILNGKRSLTLTMIRKLREGLGISADILIGMPEPQLQGS